MGSILNKLKQLFSGKQIEVVIVGLQCSGKSTLTSQLSMEKVKDKGPTLGLDVKSFKQGSVTMNVWDLGGHVNYRPEWVHYAVGCDVILFVVDSSDKEKIPQAKLELHKLLSEKLMNNIPLLVIGNKIDLPGHLNEKEIIEQMSLDYLDKNQWLVIMASALNGTNIEQVIDWLINKSKKKNN